MSAVEFEPVSVEDVKKLLKTVTSPVFHKATDPFKALRRREAPVVLEGYAIAWMAKLPRAVQPRACGERYPRIVNKLAALWDVDERVTAYLRDLLVDTRGTRQGFPPHIAQELTALRAYRLQANLAKSNDAWTLEPMERV